MTLEERREKKLKMYNFFEESLEERLAGVKAAKAKLEEQIERQEINMKQIGKLGRVQRVRLQEWEVLKRMLIELRN